MGVGCGCWSGKHGEYSGKQGEEKKERYIVSRLIDRALDLSIVVIEGHCWFVGKDCVEGLVLECSINKGPKKSERRVNTFSKWVRYRERPDSNERDKSNRECMGKLENCRKKNSKYRPA